MGTRGPFPRDKVQLGHDGAHSPHLVPRSIMRRSYTSSPLGACMAWWDSFFLIIIITPAAATATIIKTKQKGLMDPHEVLTDSSADHLHTQNVKNTITDETGRKQSWPNHLQVEKSSKPVTIPGTGHNVRWEFLEHLLKTIKIINKTHTAFVSNKQEYCCVFYLLVFL
jgi:hypothetical protein